MNLSDIDLNKIFVFAESLINSRDLLSTLKISGNENWLIIDDLSLAIEYATSQNPKLPTVQVWGDLRQTEAGRIPWVKGLYQEWEGGIGEKLYHYIVSIGVEEDLYADIDADIYNICVMTYFHADDPFWKMLGYVYSKGGWPCGWARSEYPGGSLIVFAPQS